MDETTEYKVPRTEDGKFLPGTGGRPKGTRNKLTIQARECAAHIVDDPVYLAQIKMRALAGTLHPTIEKMLWEYRYGKVVERHKVQVDDSSADRTANMTELPAEQLAQRAADVAQRILEAKIAGERRLEELRLEQERIAQMLLEKESVDSIPTAPGTH